MYYKAPYFFMLLSSWHVNFRCWTLLCLLTWKLYFELSLFSWCLHHRGKQQYQVFLQGCCLFLLLTPFFRAGVGGGCLVFDSLQIMWKMVSMSCVLPFFYVHVLFICINSLTKQTFDSRLLVLEVAMRLPKRWIDAPGLIRNALPQSSRVGVWILLAIASLSAIFFPSLNFLC